MPVAGSGLFRRCLASLVATLIVLELVSFTGIARAPHALFAPADADPFVGAMLAAAFVVHAAARPKLIEIGLTILIGAALAMAGLACSAWVDLRGAIGVLGVGLGDASLLALAVATLRARGDERRAILSTLEIAVGLALLGVTMRAGADLTVALHPITRDAGLVRVETAIVGARLASFDRWLAPAPAVRDLCLALYHLSPIALGVALVRARRLADRDRPPLLESAIAAGLASFGIAQALPILGPLRAGLRSGAAERFGTPALHVVLAVLVLAAMWRAGSVARALAAAWLAITIAAALLLGEARLLDLVLAPALALVILRALTKLSGGPSPIVGPQTIDPSEKSSLARAVAPIFFASGFAGLVYEVVFGKHLALTFGSTAQAAATVLATYMGGMALGSWAGGRLGARGAEPLRVYALSELGIGAWCAISPITFALVRAAYVALATRLGHAWLPALQFALGGLAMLPATFLMGVTMPVLTRRLIAEDAALGRAVGLLYGANTLGAAAGAFLAGYFMLPAFGVTRSTWIAVALNIAAAILGLRLARAFGRDRTSKEAPSEAAANEPAASPDASRERTIALAILFGGGAVTLALEVAYTHLLAVVAGNSAYAFSLMLFAFLVGLGLGAALMRAAMRARAVGLAAVGAVEIALSIAILAGVFVWESIPAYFASFGDAHVNLGFAERELVRFAVCCVAMIPPAIAIGALYPAAMEIASRSHPRGPVAGVGRAAAINTAGNIAGAILGSFVLLPALGSLRALHALAALAALLGLSVLLVAAGRRAVVPACAAIAAILFIAQPKRFDLQRLASGANVYFMANDRGPVIDHAESVSGGLTTVNESIEPDGAVVRTMLTNGKFQGDDSARRQVKAQFGFGLSPLLHTDKRDHALVIGFGVGGTTRVLRDAGFARTDVAELSEDVLVLAHKHFRTTNDGVLSHPSVRAHVVDGRNFLLLSRDAYDLVTIEISSIWFAGAATLYNRELYALVKKRLAPGGVLVQWVQLHHMAREDFISILASVRAEMPRVWVYLIGSQGMMIACDGDCAPRPETIAAVDRTPALREVVQVFGGSVAGLRNDELLGPAEVDRLLHDFASARGRTVESFVSTDDDMRLEYRTPRGNVLPAAASFDDNLRMLRAVRGR